MLDALLGKTRRVSLWLTWFAGILIVGSAFLVTTEVILRKLFNVSLGGADEISGYAFGVATTLSLSYALFERAHIRVDALVGVMPNWLRTPVNFFGLFLLVSFAGIVVTMIWSLVMDTLEFNSRSITPMRVPLAIPQIPWMLGWMFFVFSGCLIGLAALQRWIKRDHSGVQDLIGVKSLDEQIQDETV
ncbi:MAG: TRAP transporter small permease [Marinovum sp.]|nr:TRAP transporter small permease [Marinovum sp.]